MIIKHKIYHCDTESKSTTITVEVVFEGSGIPIDEHKIIGIVVKEDDENVIVVGKECE